MEKKVFDLLRISVRWVPNVSWGIGDDGARGFEEGDCCLIFGACLDALFAR